MALLALTLGRKYTGSTELGLVLFIAGGASNWIDRVLRGSVVDFLNMGIGPLRTGVFNLADVAIMLGAALFVFGELVPNQGTDGASQPSRGSAVSGIPGRLRTRQDLHARQPDWRRAAACSATRTIETPPIYDDAELALFEHELGHLENPVGRADRASLEGATACERVTACP